MATITSHLHILVSWKDIRGWMPVRKSLKTFLTRRLNQEGGKVKFSRGASRKKVANRGHFNYLKSKYLPDHKGTSWYEPSQ